jgi:hypothetical protein
MKIAYITLLSLPLLSIIDYTTLTAYLLAAVFLIKTLCALIL